MCGEYCTVQLMHKEDLLSKESQVALLTQKSDSAVLSPNCLQELEAIQLVQF